MRQGEPTVFVRLAGCDRRCSFCDTKYAWEAGRDWTVRQILDRVQRIRRDYPASWVCLTGGEPFMQPAFTLELLRQARAEGLHTCVETCGCGRPADIAEAAPLVDLFLFDYKETDLELHRQFTGQDLEPIMENLRLLDAAGARIVLRCPLVPGHNLRDAHLEGIAELSRSLRGCEAVEIMGYHRLGVSKVERLGMEAEERVPPQTRDLTDAEIEGAIEALRGLGAVSPRRS
jgi:pyruvate formate lyase activating enzyme